MKSLLYIGELAITSCQSIAGDKRDFALADQIAQQVMGALSALESEEIRMLEDAVRAIRQCEAILSDCEELPERAEDFATGVIETVESIQGWIEENRHVTEKQVAALESMAISVGNWLHR